MARLSPAPTGSTTRRLALALTLLVALLCTPTASADTGDLSYRGCIGTLAGCGPTNPATALSGATAVAMTPDGEHLYTAGGDVVSHFLVDSTGDIAFAGCVGNLIGCTPTSPATALASRTFAGLAISADGRHLYLANTAGVSHLRLDTAGNATFAGCVGSLTGCTTTTPASALSSAVGIALKDRHLYVGSLAADSVSHLTINDTGDLTFAGCAGNLSGCTSLRVTTAATDPFSLALSPDGGHLYSTSFTGTLGNVAHWTLGATGNLAFAGCIGNRPGCATTTPAGALNGARGLDLSANGQHLYAAANGAGAVAWMTIDGAGNPQVRGCVGQSGCTPVTPATALNGAFQVSITPDGSRLYVVSLISDAVSHLRLGSTGAPSFASCSGGLSGCAPIAPATALNGASGVAVRPNGSHVYVAAVDASAVSRFSIAPPPSPPAPPAAPAPAAPRVVVPGGIDGDNDGFFAGQDCNDANRAIRPGAVEIKGNRLDENCDGLAEPFPTLTSGVVNKWDVKGKRLKLTALQISQQFPKGMKVEIICKGAKCPVKSKALKAGKVRRGAANVIASLSAKQRRFRAGQTVEVWVSAPSFNTKVARFALRKGTIPTTQPLCVLRGQSKPQKTCT